jgi:hypothetical protein
MLFTASLAILSVLSTSVLAENPDGVWGWASLTPAKGYVNTTFPVQDGAKAFAYIDEAYDESKIERAIIQ